MQAEAPPLVALYQARERSYAADASRLGSKSALVSNLRGLSFGAAVVLGLGAAFSDHALWLAGPACLAGLCFGVLVIWHARVIDEEAQAITFQEVNASALARCTGAWRTFAADGSRFAGGPHPYAGDLDLFGKGSVFQYLNTAHTYFGEQTLAGFLSAHDQLEALHLRQEAARELAPQLEHRQRTEALALRAVQRRIPGGPKGKNPAAGDPSALLQWFEEPPATDDVPQVHLLAKALPLVTLLVFVLAKVLGWSPITWGVALLAQIAVAVRYQQRAAKVFQAVSSAEGLFRQMGPLVQQVEQLDATCQWLRNLREQVRLDGEPASTALKKFASYVGYFEVRHNGLIHPVFNAVFLWDLNCVLALESWRARWGTRVRSWIDAVGQLEAVNSLAALSHDNPDYAWPTFIDDGQLRFVATGLAHPLQSRSQRIANDVALGESYQALLVTGSNMSGKSTLLRSVGVACVMALAGAPVCARSLRLSKLRVHTSMRISDSLSEGVSHFYAELAKLRSVLTAAQAGQPVLFLLDEILHGTNSRERQIGARWVLAELLRAGAIGAVSTHDQELCVLSQALLRDTLHQAHFREQVTDGRMTFDYQLREGPVSGGNALRLMRSVGLMVPEEAEPPRAGD